ncbi:MAG: HAD family phosphatase [Pseudomonadota bacterium]
MSAFGPEALLFDMDGLLLDSERVYLDAGIAVMRPYGVSDEASRAFFLTLVGTSSALADQLIEDWLPAGIDMETFNETWFAEVEAQMAAHVPVMRDVAEGLEQLNGRLPMAVVTSTETQKAKGHLAGGGLLDHFAFVLGCDQVAAHKPDPMPYLEAARRIGVPPGRCAAFEDSDKGITAAMGAGCYGIQIPDLRPADAKLPQLGQHVAADFRAALLHLALI